MNGDRSDIGRPTDPRGVLKAQYRMALKMLDHAIDKCPDSLWLSAEGHGAAYWRLAFHTLFFTHFYLQKDQQKHGALGQATAANYRTPIARSTLSLPTQKPR